MPQPLSVVDPTAQIFIGQPPFNPVEQRPALAAEGMGVIAEWSMVESTLTNVFVGLLGVDPEPAVAIFAAFFAGHVQRSALTALARHSLDGEHLEIFDAIMKIYLSLAKERNKVAHHVWGYSPQLPDAVLLVDPGTLLRRFAAFDLQMMDRSWPRGEIPTDSVYVYKESDFKDLRARLGRMHYLLSQLYSVLVTRKKGHEIGEMVKTRFDFESGFAELAKEPGIQRILAKKRAKAEKAASQAEVTSPR